jgi:phage anti-repressor protein
LVRQNGRIKDEKSEVSEANSGRGGDRRSVTYHITLDMAKELAMVDRNEMGRLARQYFIQCESALRQKQLETHKQTHATDNLEDNQITNLLQFMRSRASYWSIKKRDLIYQPGVDHDTLFSILEDIEFSTHDELYNQFRKKFPMAYQSIYFSDMRKFIHEWTPHFFRNKQTSKLVHTNV